MTPDQQRYYRRARHNHLRTVVGGFGVFTNRYVLFFRYRTGTRHPSGAGGVVVAYPIMDYRDLGRARHMRARYEQANRRRVYIYDRQGQRILPDGRCTRGHTR